MSARRWWRWKKKERERWSSATTSARGKKKVPELPLYLSLSLSLSYLEDSHLDLGVLDAAVVVDVDGREDAARDEREEGFEDALMVEEEEEVQMVEEFFVRILVSVVCFFVFVFAFLGGAARAARSSGRGRVGGKMAAGVKKRNYALFVEGGGRKGNQGELDFLFCMPCRFNLAFRHQTSSIPHFAYTDDYRVSTSTHQRLRGSKSCSEKGASGRHQIERSPQGFFFFFRMLQI